MSIIFALEFIENSPVFHPLGIIGYCINYIELAMMDIRKFNVLFQFQASRINSSTNQLMLCTTF